jgi:hypothetical protein
VHGRVALKFHKAILSPLRTGDYSIIPEALPEIQNDHAIQFRCQMGGQHCGASVANKPLTTSVSLDPMTITKLVAFVWRRSRVNAFLSEICGSVRSVPWNDFSAQIYHGIIDLIDHKQSIVARTDGRYSANTPP